MPYWRVAGMLCLVMVMAALTVGCRPSASSPAAEAAAGTRLQGAGATFPAPFYKRLVVVYQGIHPHVLIDYQSMGSGGGIQAITDQTVHFCGSDAPMNEKELERVGGAENILEFPACAGGVAPTYNVPGVTAPLKFTGKLLCDIYLGKVSQWNDPAIVAINPGVPLPDLAITPVWRTDGSGTTFIFTSYLATQSEEFATTVGFGKQVQWPFGQGGKGNEGVTAVVQQTAGGIGYVEQTYAENNRLLSGEVQNKAGKFVKASPESISAASAGPAGKMEGQILAADIWDQPAADAYPIASFTYLIVYKDLKNLSSKKSAQDLVSFLWWTVHEGQQHARELGYAPLAPEVQAKVAEVLKGVTYKGERLSVGD